ncbi:MAG: site-specific integrase [Methanobacterium sp.]
MKNIYSIKNQSNVMKNVDEDPKLQRYYRKRHLSQSSKTSYTYAFRYYYRSTGLTPSEAIDQADDDEEAGIRLKRRRIVQHLEDYEDLLETKLGESTLKTYIIMVKSFYRFYGIMELPENRRRPPRPTKEDSVEQLPSTDELKKAISNSSIKFQAIIILLATTGMRQGDLRNLTLKDLCEALKEYIRVDPEDFKDIEKIREQLPKTFGPLTWHYFMQKGAKWQTTFSTPESLHFILNYLEVKPPTPFKPETRLFCGLPGKKQNQQTFNRYFQRVNKKCGFPQTRPSYFRPHNLRKWFSNQLKTNMGWIEPRILMGHKVQDETGRRYLKPDYNDLKKKYYSYMDDLTLFSKVEVYDTTDDRIMTLEKEKEELEKRMIELEKENKKRNEDLEILLNNPTVLKEITKNL